MRKLAALVIGVLAFTAVPALAGKKPASGNFRSGNGTLSFFIKQDRVNGTASGVCPIRGDEAYRYFPQLKFKVKNGKIKFDGRTRFVDSEAGTSKVRVTLNAEFVTSKKATGSFRIYAPPSSTQPNCNKKRTFTAKWFLAQG